MEIEKRKETYRCDRPPCPRCGSRVTAISSDNTTWVCFNCELSFNPETAKFNWKRVIPYCPYCEDVLCTDDRVTWYCIYECGVFAQFQKKEKRWEILYPRERPKEKPSPTYCCVCGERVYYVEAEELWECPRCGAVHIPYPPD